MSSESGGVREPAFSHFEAVGIPQINEQERDRARTMVSRTGRWYPVADGKLEGRQWVDWDSGAMLEATMYPAQPPCLTPQYADGMRVGAQITELINDQNCLGCIIAALDLYDDQMNELGRAGISPAGVSWRWAHLGAARRMGWILTVKLTYMVETVAEHVGSVAELDDGLEAQPGDKLAIGLNPQFYIDRGQTPWPPAVSRLVVVVDEVEQRTTEEFGLPWWHMQVHGAITGHPWVLVAEPRVLPKVEPGDALIVGAWGCGTLSLTRSEAREQGFAY